MSESEQGLGKLPIHIRTTADAFRNDAIASAIKSSGRTTVLISGVATELAVPLPAISGTELGYGTFILIDASGGTSERMEQSAL